MPYDDWKLATPPEFDDEPRKPRYYVDRTPAPKTSDPKTNDPNLDDDINF